MNTKRKVFTVIVFLSLTLMIKAQTTSSINLANKIADKMMDSLTLSKPQRQQVFDINIQIAANKMQARNQFQNTDSVGSVLQRIENSRDSLYKTVLTGEQMILYRQKKRNLVTNK